MGRNTTLAILFALIAAHVALAIAFASITPFRTAGLVVFGQRDPKTGLPPVEKDIGAPDERQHVNYIARLAHGGGVPVFNPKDPNLYETYQSHQPPLFYTLESLWASVTGAYLPPAPPATEGKEMTQDDGLKLRSLNVLIGATTVGGVFMLAWWGYRRQGAALLAAAFAALLPMNAALSGAVSNDPLLICLCTWALALVAHGVRDGWTTKNAIGVGILSGLAILTKSNGIALLPVLLLVAILPSTRPRPTQLVAAIVPILLCAVPWWLRSTHLYGDPLASKYFKEAFGGTAQASMFIEGYGPIAYWTQWVGWWTARSFIGVFGYMDIWLTNTGGPGGAAGIYQLGLLLLLLGLAGWASSLRTTEPEAKRVHLLNGLFAVIVLALFLIFNATYFQAQARYLFPALGPIACGMGIGFASLYRKNPKLPALALLVGLVAIDGFALSKLPAEFEKRVELAKQVAAMPR